MSGLKAAAAAGHRVLVSRPGERETKLAYSALGDRRAVFDEALADAPSPQRKALEIALLRTTASIRPDHRAIGLGVLEAFRKLAASSPLFIGVDDVQWLDGSSARALSFAIRRLEGSPVSILCTRLLESGSEDPLELVRALSVKTLFGSTSAPFVRKRLAASFETGCVAPSRPPSWRVCTRRPAGIRCSRSR